MCAGKHEPHAAEPSAATLPVEHGISVSIDGHAMVGAAVAAAALASRPSTKTKKK